MAVDGAANRVYEVTPTAEPEGPGNPVGNAWRAKEVLIADETMARREADPLAGRYWKIVNENVKNELGQPVGYKLLPSHTIRPFAHPGSAVARRAAFMFHPVWVTAYDRDELFATGDYPNQSEGGDGLPAFAAGGGTSPTPTWCSGSPSAPTTSSAPRTGRSCRSTRSASGCSRPASSSATRRSTTPSPAAPIAITDKSRTTKTEHQ